MVCYPYNKWEDFLNGMYRIPDKPYNEDLILDCVNLLENEKGFFESSLSLIREWKISAEHNLSNKSINRQAWIGQAACCYKYKAPELVTRVAWSRVKPLNKIKANKIADKIIRIYEAENRKLYKGVEEEGLLC